MFPHLSKSKDLPRKQLLKMQEILFGGLHSIWPTGYSCVSCFLPPCNSDTCREEKELCLCALVLVITFIFWCNLGQCFCSCVSQAASSPCTGVCWGKVLLTDPVLDVLLQHWKPLLVRRGAPPQECLPMSKPCSGILQGLSPPAAEGVLSVLSHFLPLACEALSFHLIHVLPGALVDKLSR